MGGMDDASYKTGLIFEEHDLQDNERQINTIDSSDPRILFNKATLFLWYYIPERRLLLACKPILKQWEIWKFLATNFLCSPTRLSPYHANPGFQ